MKTQDRYMVQRQFFEKAYAGGNTGWPKTGASRIIDMAASAGFLSKGSRFLEIGCGEGRNLLPPLLAGCHTVGLDYVFSPLLDQVRSVEASLASLVRGDLFHLPFRPGSFDVVLDWGVLHHLRAPEREKYPSWIGDVLAPRGVLLLGAFSEHFRHYPGEERQRNWVSHRGHYDVFFTRESFSKAMGKAWTLLSESEEVSGGEIHHYRLGIFGRSGDPENRF